jgi:hypothetical protein
VLQILLAEDNEGDVMLVEQALEEHQIDNTGPGDKSFKSIIS